MSTSSRLPNFFCVGAQKAGTTTLFDVLRQHPEVYLPAEKEAHFFDWDERYSKGIDWYATTYFAEAGAEPAIGTITPSYLYDSRVPQRMAEALGTKVKLIFLFRHPADRAYSHYLMEFRKQHETLEFAEALDAEPGRIAVDSKANLRYSYAARGRYSEQVQRFLAHFDRDNMLFLHFEHDWVQNRQETVNRISRFLGISELPLDVDFRSNAAGEVRSAGVAKAAGGGWLGKIGKAIVANPEMRKKLRHKLKRANTKAATQTRLSPEVRSEVMQTYFADEATRLTELTGLDCSSWNVE